MEDGGRQIGLTASVVSTTGLWVTLSQQEKSLTVMHFVCLSTGKQEEEESREETLRLTQEHIYSFTWLKIRMTLSLLV